MADLEATFRALRKVMEPFAAGLARETDTDTELYLEQRLERGKPSTFGAVQLKKNYVSYHLVPLYTDPDLLGAVSPELKKRMQGKACFNFKTADPALFGELAALTGAALERFWQNVHAQPEERDG